MNNNKNNTKNNKVIPRIAGSQSKSSILERVYTLSEHNNLWRLCLKVLGQDQSGISSNIVVLWLYVYL